MKGGEKMKKIVWILILVVSSLFLSSCTGLVSILWNVTGVWDALLDATSTISDYRLVELKLTKTGNDISGGATVTYKNEITNQVTGKATGTNLHIEIVTSSATITLDGTMISSDEIKGVYLLDDGAATYTGDWRGNKR